MPGTRRAEPVGATCLPGLGALVCRADNVNVDRFGGRVRVVTRLHHFLLVRHLARGGSLRFD